MVRIFTILLIALLLIITPIMAQDVLPDSGKLPAGAEYVFSACGIADLDYEVVEIYNINTQARTVGTLPEFYGDWLLSMWGVPLPFTRWDNGAPDFGMAIELRRVYIETAAGQVYDIVMPDPIPDYVLEFRHPSLSPGQRPTMFFWRSIANRDNVFAMTFDYSPILLYRDDHRIETMYSGDGFPHPCAGAYFVPAVTWQSVIGWHEMAQVQAATASNQ